MSEKDNKNPWDRGNAITNGAGDKDFHEKKTDRYLEGFPDWLNKKDESLSFDDLSNGASENSENKKDDSSILNDSGDISGSNSPTKSCEVCEGKTINCLCDVKIQPKKADEKKDNSATEDMTCPSDEDGENDPVLYHWKGGEIVKKPKDLQFLMGLDPFSVKYDVIGECDHNTSPCTKLYSYQYLTKNTHQNYEEKGQSGSLVLRYDPKVKEELKNKESTKMMCFLNEQGTDIVFNEGMTGDWIERAISFFAFSDFYDIPLTAYQLLVPECDTGLIDKRPTMESNAIKRKADIKALVLPNYEVNVGISINTGKGLDAKHTFIGTSSNDKPALAFEVIINQLKEKLNGDEINSSINTNLSGLSALSSIRGFDILGNFDKFLSKIELKGLEMGDGMFILRLTPPKVELNGIAKLQADEKGSLSIERSGQLKLDPLIGFRLTFDALDAFLKAFPPARVLTAGKKILKMGIFRETSPDQVQKVRSRIAAAGKKDFIDEFMDNFEFSATAKCEIRLKLHLAGELQFLSSKVLEEPPQRLLSGAYSELELSAELDLEVEIRFFDFQSTFSATFEVKASLKFYYVKVFDGTETISQKGSVKDGNGNAYEFVIQSSGVGVKWSVKYQLSYKDESIFDVSSESESSNKLTREEWMQKNGFDVIDGAVIEDEEYYDDKYPYLRVKGGSGYDISGSSQIQNLDISNRKQKREDFRGMDKGEQVVSKEAVLYPPHRVGRETIA